MKTWQAAIASVPIMGIGGAMPPATAAVSAAVALDNIDSEFDYWPDRQRKAREFETSGGHHGRVYKPQLMTTGAGGLLVTFTIDHEISFGRDEHAAVALTFDQYGVVANAQNTIRLASAKNTFQSVADVVGDGAAESALAGAGQVGAAVALVAKVLAGFGNAVGGQVNQNGGTELLPYEVQFVSEHIAKAVYATGYGAKILHDGNGIQFWRGGSCGQAGIGSIGSEAQSIRLLSHGIPNDQIRSVRNYKHVPPATSILLFDDGSGSKSKDHWAEIKVADSARFDGVAECVATLQRNRDDGAIHVEYHMRKGKGNLDAKVSHLTGSP